MIQNKNERSYSDYGYKLIFTNFLSNLTNQKYINTLTLGKSSFLKFWHCFFIFLINKSGKLKSFFLRIF